MKNDVEIWVQRGTEGEIQARFVVTRTGDPCANLLGGQNYQAES